MLGPINLPTSGGPIGPRSRAILELRRLSRLTAPLPRGAEASSKTVDRYLFPRIYSSVRFSLIPVDREIACPAPRSAVDPLNDPLFFAALLNHLRRRRDACVIKSSRLLNSSRASEAGAARRGREGRGLGDEPPGMEYKSGINKFMRYPGMICAALDEISGQCGRFLCKFPRASFIPKAASLFLFDPGSPFIFIL